MSEINSKKQKSKVVGNAFFEASLGLGFVNNTIPNARSFIFNPPIFQAFETMRQVNENLVKTLEPIKAVAETVKMINSFNDNLIQSFKAFREAMDRMREQMTVFLKFIGQIAQLSIASVFTDLFGWTHKLWRAIHKYKTLQRIRDGDPQAYKEVVALFPAELRSFKRLKGNDFQVEDFINIVYEKFMMLSNKFGELEEQTIDVLFEFLKKLFYAIRDEFRRMARELQIIFVYDKGINEALIDHEGVNYILIPTLSQVTNIPSSTLRRWVAQKIIPAQKLTYVSIHSGNKSDAWHIPYTQEVLKRIKELKGISPRQRKALALGYYTRQQAAQMAGLGESTLKIWERQGRINPKREGRRLYYTENDIDQIQELIDNKLHPASKLALTFS